MVWYLLKCIFSILVIVAGSTISFQNIVSPLSVDNYSKDRPGKGSNWEPLEGSFEIPSMSGSLSLYDKNIDKSNNTTGVLTSTSTSLFSRMKMAELYICGSGGTNQYDGLYSYNGNGIEQVESFPAEDYIANTIVKTKALDINGDAHEDILIASFDKKNKKITLNVRLYDTKDGNNSFVKSSNNIKTNNEIKLWETTNDNVGGIIVATDKQGFDCCDFITGDFDGDHKKEFALSLSYSVNKHGQADIYIIDDYEADCKLLYNYTETDPFSRINANDSSKVFKFASADIDGDGYDEIYAAIGANGKDNQGYYKVYKYEPGSLITLACDKLAAGTNKYSSLCTAIVDVGDVDGDGATEIVFEGRQQDYTNCKVLVLKYDSQKKEYFWLASSPAGGFQSNEKPYIPMAVGDIDQDGIEEIVLANDALRYNSKSTDSDQIESIVSGTKLPCLAGNGSLAIGDFNYDGINEIAQVNYEGDELFFSVYDKDAGFISSPAYRIQRANAKNDSPVSICAVAATKGIARFKFVEHTLKFTEPDVIALVAAPLYFSEDYNGGVDPEEFQPSFGNQGTALIKSTSSSSSFDGTFSVSTSTSGGLCVKDPIGITGIELKVGIALEKAYEHTWGESKSEEFEVSYCTHEKDMVVIKVTPMDFYLYEIVNMPSAPDWVGQQYYISVPRASYVKVCEVDFYEDNKAKDAPSVKSLFTHTAGNPYSYDSYDEVLKKIADTENIKCENVKLNKLSGDYFIVKENQMETVPQGNVETTMSFSKNSESYEGDGFNISAGIETEAESEGLYTTWGITFAGGDSWTSSIGSGTTIEGTVVGIDAKYANDYSFKWGIILI